MQLALQFGSICRSFGLVQWNRALFRHCSWVAVAEVLDYYSRIQRFAGLGAPFWELDGVKWALERCFGRPDGVKWALERRFGRPDGVKLALEWRFSRPSGAKLALERRSGGPGSAFWAP